MILIHKILCFLSYNFTYNNIKKILQQTIDNKMSDKSHKNRLGITRSRYSEYLKIKNKRSSTRKRFSKTSLKKASTQTLITKLTMTYLIQHCYNTHLRELVNWSLLKLVNLAGWVIIGSAVWCWLKLIPLVI